MAIADRHGLPVSATIASGERHEVRLVQQTLDARFTDEAPGRLVGDRAYDSAALEQDLAEQGIELVCPLRRGGSARRPDGRVLRRYKRRWKVERLFAWLLRNRRLTERYERKAANFLGFVLLGCLKILLNHL
jgi:transposase